MTASIVTITLTGNTPHLVGYDRGFSIQHVRRFAPRRAPGARCLLGPYDAQPPTNTPTAIRLKGQTRALYVRGRAYDTDCDLDLPLVWTPGSRVRVPLRAPAPAAPATLARLARLFGEASWTFASSYAATNPHHYSRRRDWSDDSAFVWAVEQIQRLGYRQRFEGAWWTQLDVVDHFYWTGYEPPTATKWINRKPLARSAVPIAVQQSIIADDARVLRVPALPDGWRDLSRALTRDAHFQLGVALFGDAAEWAP